MLHNPSPTILAVALALALAVTLILTLTLTLATGGARDDAVGRCPRAQARPEAVLTLTHKP